MDPKGERVIKSNNTIIGEAMNVVSNKSDYSHMQKKNNPKNQKYMDQEARNA